jgi:anti-sigma factor ChrR (cupin superfamily)
VLIPVELDLASALALPWQPTRTPGVHWILLASAASTGSAGRSDPTVRADDVAERRGATALIRMDPGCGYPPHRHLGCEDVLVLLGAYRDELGVHSKGAHVHYEAQSSHAPLALGAIGRIPSERDPPCVLFAVASAGIEILGDGGSR